VHGSPTLLEALCGVLFLFYALRSIMPVSAPVREVGSAWLPHATWSTLRGAFFVLCIVLNNAD